VVDAIEEVAVSSVAQALNIDEDQVLGLAEHLDGGVDRASKPRAADENLR
jgi:hypothetical protein